MTQNLVISQRKILYKVYIRELNRVPSTKYQPYIYQLVSLCEILFNLF